MCYLKKSFLFRYQTVYIWSNPIKAEYINLFLVRQYSGHLMMIKETSGDLVTLGENRSNITWVTINKYTMKNQMALKRFVHFSPVQKIWQFDDTKMKNFKIQFPDLYQ